mmetsp:Transcript_93811/g.195673  ORF Transcript_93811/g.195673 Transcript_93811/m.195673 type:complete len:92 (-) Transcript_93811:1825-2100(-)
MRGRKIIDGSQQRSVIVTFAAEIAHINLYLCPGFRRNGDASAPFSSSICNWLAWGLPAFLYVWLQAPSSDGDCTLDQESAGAPPPPWAAVC